MPYLQTNTSQAMQQRQMLNRSQEQQEIEMHNYSNIFTDQPS